MEISGRCSTAALAIVMMSVMWSPLAARDETSLECWWRTGVTAVRVGQPFLLLLTCMVAENGRIAVVVDESVLDPAVIQLAPFEVTAGTRARDLRANDRRLFQYEYTLRLIDNEVFGKDVPIPSLQISYHVQTHVRGDAIEGVTRSYVLPPESMHILSLVPSGAAGIRDATFETFREIAARRFRANTLLIAAILQLCLSAAIAVTAIGHSRSAASGAGASLRPLSNARILRAALRELSAIRRERELSGWTDGLVTRVSTALRIGGACALSRHVSQTPAANGGEPQDGQFVVNANGFRRRRVFVSASTTARALANAQQLPHTRTPEIERLLSALSRLDAALYGKASSIGETELDQSLDEGVRATKQVAFENGWPIRVFKGWR